jgi:nucleotide-binding universal stress UspA family protein
VSGEAAQARDRAVNAAKTVQTHRIVVGIDGSEGARRALEWAAAQARLTGSVLDIVTASGESHALADPHVNRETEQKDIDEASVQARTVAPGATIATRVFDGAPAPVLIEESEGADLLVVGTRGRGGFASLVLGSVSRRCVHQAHCPVVVVSATESDQLAAQGPSRNTEAATTAAAEQPHRIVVGVDGAPSSIAAAEWAATQAELSGATLEALMTWEWPATYGWAPGATEYDPRYDCEVMVEDALNPIRDRHPSIRIEAIVEEGHPAQHLLEAADGADLLVVGCHGEGELAGMLLGSVTEHCVAHARCPVVVVRDDSSSPVTRRSGPRDRSKGRP